MAAEVVCRRCYGEVCSAIWADGDVAAGAAAVLVVAEVLAVVVDLAEALAEAATLAAEARAAVGKKIGG